ncbi:hypothetical protein BBEV_3128 [Salisediminibacterium beveridgei]|uniref:Uncharacterized protein n=1 Tax=Salisediminibacterium beveridgei TaxID=632773 RepID=A0A1D7QZL5_9BACI|nr:hypothetical protein BBEV_3128 [Salisediminibacterium beveridgei]
MAFAVKDVDEGARFLDGDDADVVGGNAVDACQCADEVRCSKLFLLAAVYIQRHDFFVEIGVFVFFSLRSRRQFLKEGFFASFHFRFRWGRGEGNDRPCVAFKVTDGAFFTVIDKGNRFACFPRTARSTGPVHIALLLKRHVVIDDKGDVVDVDPPGSDVRRDQIAKSAALKGLHHSKAFLLRETAVNFPWAVAVLIQFVFKLVHTLLGVAENQAAVRVLDLRHILQDLDLLLVCDVDDGLVNGVRGDGFLTDRDLLWFLHILLGEAFDLVTDGGREDRCGAPFRKLFDDGFHLIDEAHIEHLIRFVDDEVLDPVEKKGPFFDVIQDPSRCPDDDVGFLFQLEFLLGKGFLSVNRRGFDAFEAADIGDVFLDLCRQFPGGREN